jgi:microcystin-dependent protein
MSEPFLGQIKMVGFQFAPKGYALCDGQIMPISQNTALFALLGTTFGGDGVHNFALPNLQGRTPLHSGNGFTLGQQGGEEAHTLISTEMAAHSHQVLGDSAEATQRSPVGNTWAAKAAATPFSSTTNTQMNPAALSLSGGGQPHNNLQPYLVINFIIALAGIFPSRN